MGDYFSNLVARTMGLAPSMEPRPLSRFEPPSLYPEAFGPLTSDMRIQTTTPSEDQNVASEITTAPPLTERRRARSQSNASASNDAVPKEDTEPEATSISIGTEAAMHDSATKVHASLHRPRRETRVPREVSAEPAETSIGMPASNETIAGERRPGLEPTRPAFSRRTSRSIESESSSVSADSKATLPHKAADPFPPSPQPTRAATNVRPTGETSIEKPILSIDSSLERTNTKLTDSRVSRSKPADRIAARKEPARNEQSNAANFPTERVFDGGNRFNESRGPVRPERVSLAIEAGLSSRTGAMNTELRDAEPTIHITIGRVEVKAVTAPSTKPPAAAPVKTAMSLDDYLRKRSSGGR